MLVPLLFFVSVSKWWFIISISWRHWIPFYPLILAMSMNGIERVLLFLFSSTSSSSSAAAATVAPAASVSATNWSGCYFSVDLSDQIKPIKYINALKARLSSSALIEKNSKNLLGHYNWIYTDRFCVCSFCSSILSLVFFSHSLSHHKWLFVHWERH